MKLLQPPMNYVKIIMLFWSSSNANIKEFTVLKKKVGKDKETNLNYCEISASAHIFLKAKVILILIFSLN